MKLSANNLNNSKSNLRNLSGRICYKCGKYGHISTTCNYKRIYRGLSESNSEYILIKGSHAIIMDKLQYDLKAITKDYQKAFKELVSVNKEGLKNSDIKHQVNQLKKKYRGIKKSFKNYEVKQAKIQQQIKEFNKQNMTTRLIDLIKQEIGYANKNLTDYMKKSVVQAINPNYKGGNQVLAEKIRENLNIDEKSGKVSIRKEVELKNNMAFEKLERKFKEMEIKPNLVQSVIAAIKRRGDEWQDEVQNEIPKYKRKELLEKLKKIIDANKYAVMPDKHKEEVIKHCDKMSEIKQDYENALFEATNEYGDIKTQLEICERELLAAQSDVAKYCQYTIIDKLGNNISQKISK